MSGPKFLAKANRLALASRPAVVKTTKQAAASRPTQDPAMAEDVRRDDGEDRGPGADYGTFAVMEGLLEKLKLLDYEEKVLVKHNIMKNLSR